MNSIDHGSGGPRHPEEETVQEADPYRAPTSVPDERKRRGLLGSPIAWGVVACAVLVAVGLVYARRSTQTGVINYVEDFGFERRGPVEEHQVEMSVSEVVEYEADMAAEATPQP